MFMRKIIMQIINRKSMWKQEPKSMWKQKPRYYFEGKGLFKFDECGPCCALMPEEEKSWEKLKQHLRDNSITVWCTFTGWDNFLNRTIFTGNVDSFIEYLDWVVEKFPSDMYHLTDGGELRKAEVVK